MKFRVLGPLEAGDERGSLALGPRKQRALLARLLLDSGRTVAVERLIDDLWGEAVPDTAVKMVQIYVSGLRKVLPEGMLQTRPPGYSLEIDPEDLDLHRFERLTAAGRTALAEGDATTAAARLREALGLWRGPALGEFTTEPFARAERDRLDELRLAAQEERIEADLALGCAAEVVAELEALTEHHPLRERLREQLMIALYRTGRHADALAAYREFRATLDEQLGIEPSARLRAVERAILMQDAGLDAPAGAPPAAHGPAPPGREEELAALRAALHTAVSGARRLVLVSGEPGVGKSTLVEALLAEVRDALVLRGQCVEHRGPPEPYLPLLDALGSAPDAAVGTALARRAPSWLELLPWLGAAPVEERARGATNERMLREMVDALEALAGERLVLLVVEDLQWADPSTLDLLGALMRRRHPARLLVLVTRDGPDPLVRRLRVRGVATEIELGPLDAKAAAAAFGVSEEIAGELVRRCAGNPMFMRHMSDHLAATGTLDGVPESLEEALRSRLETLDEESLELLQGAAVAGLESTAAAVSAALGREVDGVEVPGVVETRAPVRWPDGTTTSGYAFVHALHRDVLLETIDPARRAEMHRRVGERLEAAFGAGPEAAHEIARHYVAGRLPAPAMRFLRLAAEQAFARRAYPEGIALLLAALDAAADMPAGAVRHRAEVELLCELGQAHVATDGWSSDDALHYLERARTTAELLGDREPLNSTLLALATLHEVRGRPMPALEAARAGEEFAGQGAEGAELLACALFHHGAFSRALDYADRGAAEFEGGGEDGHYSTFPATLGDNAGVACHDWAALSLWFLGHGDEALRRARRALELSQDPSRAYSAATARAQLAFLHACRGEPKETLRWAEATIDAARDRGYAYRIAMGRVLRGWALAAGGRAEGVREIKSALEASRATGAHLEDPFYLGLLADAHLRAGDVEAGLAAADEGLETAARERAHYYDAELHRLRGELLQAAGRPGDDEVMQALAVARGQGARSLELRAALTLARMRGIEETRALLAAAREGLDDSPDTRAADALLAPPSPQRRRITVLAWELDGLGRLAEVDPDRVPHVLAACQAIARATGGEQGGHIATEDESGGLIYFGYPQALEDAPQRAVRAGRALAEALQTAVDGVELRVSIGVHTGSVVLGPVGTTSLALGDTPRTAWHLAASAAPGEVLVSDTTQALCSGYFAFGAAGPGNRVLGETGARSRLEARAGELAPLVGREQELGLLAGRWRQAREGLGQAVLVAGEEGIGKSRLVREFAAGLDCEILEFQCSAERGSSALHPVSDHFQRRVDGRPERLERLVADSGMPVSEVAPVLATLLGIPVGPPLEPSALRRRTADMVVSYVLAHAERGPVLVVFEDLHWADPSTLEVVGELLEAIADAPVLLIATFRPSLRPPWELGSHLTRIALGPCTRTESAALLTGVVPGGLAPDLARTVIERADGVPLFIEELARAVATGAEAAVPATLEDSLMARLDQLGSAAKTVAQLGATIGREFDPELLAAASELPPARIEEALGELLAAEVLRRRSRPRPGRYAFRHALLRETASQSLGERPRRAAHLRIAQALERSFPDRGRREPELVAHHFEAAGKPERALPYRFEAGRMALRRSAGVEAADHLRRAIADLHGLPDDDQRADLELAIRIPLGNALISSVGYAAPDVAESYGRARELCAVLGDDARLLPVLYGLWVNAFVGARHERALELGRELREQALRVDRAVLIVAERAVGWPLVCMGRFEEARTHLDRVGRLHDPELHEPLRFLYGQDPAVAGLATGAWALWGCGDRSGAFARAAEAVALARRTDHPLSLAYALAVAAMLAAFERDHLLAQELSAEAIAVADEFRIPVLRAWSQYALGSALLTQGDADAAGRTLRAGLQEARATDAALFEPYAMAVLAEAEARMGEIEEARRLVEEATAAAQARRELIWEGELRRVRDALSVRSA